MTTHLLAASFFMFMGWTEIALNAESAMTREQTPTAVGHSVYKTIRASRSYTQIGQNKDSTAAQCARRNCEYETTGLKE